MSEGQKKSVPHPDDLMAVGIYLAFQAKLNPNIDDPMPLYAPEIEQTFVAVEATDYLDKVTNAIRERRLFRLFVPRTGGKRGELWRMDRSARRRGDS